MYKVRVSLIVDNIQESVVMCYFIRKTLVVNKVRVNAVIYNITGRVSLIVDNINESVVVFLFHLSEFGCQKE